MASRRLLLRSMDSGSEMNRVKESLHSGNEYPNDYVVNFCILSYSSLFCYDKKVIQ